MRLVSALTGWTGCFAIVCMLPWSMSEGRSTQHQLRRRLQPQRPRRPHRQRRLKACRGWPAPGQARWTGGHRGALDPACWQDDDGPRADGCRRPHRRLRVLPHRAAARRHRLHRAARRPSAHRIPPHGLDAHVGHLRESAARPPQDHSLHERRGGHADRGNRG